MTRSLAALVALVLIMAAAVAMVASPESMWDPSKSVIGIPDDTGGLIVHYLLRQQGLPFEADITSFEAYAVKDCCASTAEWALSGNLLDLAVICPNAAERLVQKDRRFRIVGPCLFNSEVLVRRPGSELKRLGIAQRRDRQRDLLKPFCGASCAPQPMLPASLPYAYERGIVDGVVVDFLKSTSLAGERIPLAQNEGDHPTYVLVVRKEWEPSLRYRQFLDSWQRAATDLEKPEVLIKAVASFKGISWSSMETDEWKRLKIRFAPLPKAQE
ncbi:MAG: hypothetical protein KBH99_06725 [Syntrophobacteraceae bacterium]|nr:hypothetical protein [Syntrophobacteraceae bacterium]